MLHITLVVECPPELLWQKVILRICTVLCFVVILICVPAGSHVDTRKHRKCAYFLFICLLKCLNLPDLQCTAASFAHAHATSLCCFCRLPIFLMDSNHGQVI